MTSNDFEPDETGYETDPADVRDWEGAPERADRPDSSEVVELDKARAERSRRTAPDGEDQADEDAFPDRETVEDAATSVGAPVDPAEEIPASRLKPGQRKPIVPAWARSRADLYVTARRAAKDTAYVAGYHATRTPKYAAKAVVWAPVGAARTVGRLVRWATAEQGNWALRQNAADRNDAETWLRLDTQRQRQAAWRWWVTVPALLGIAAVVFLLVSGSIPTVYVVLGALVGVPVLAWLGSPEDKRITDRVTEHRAYRKLTADLVRRGLTSLGIPGINQAVAKDPGAITFPTEIHRDGPGHLATVDLPYGVEATEVIARRGRLASALRLPMDQVWPETDRTHTGRLALWVGYEPASSMPMPAWPLLGGGKVDVFSPFPFSTDPRLRACNAEVIARNWLIGGQPGSGKTFVLRLLVLACALDSRVEIRGYEFKGVGDFKALEPICTEYGNGFDNDTITRGAALMDWLYTECERRAKRIDFYATKGMAPENKVTPELASLKGSGLHPLVVFYDEVQQLFSHPQVGKRAGEMAEDVIKIGRALGVTLLFGTQIPDKDSIPTGVTRNVNTRFCLSVADQTANDMILGTSMYKNGHRATVFEPGIDAGWGISVGLGKTAPYKGFYVDNTGAAEIVARAIRYRQAAGTMPTAPTERDLTPTFDLLADVLTVWPDDKPTAWNETLIEGLAGLRPDIYDGWKPAQLTAALGNHGITVDQVGRRIDGKTVNRRGPNRQDILAAITERKQKRSREDSE